MDKPQLSVVITSIDSPSITKTYTKANGLINLNVDGIQDSIPHYGIITRAGMVELIDKDGWIKKNDSIFPDITIDILLDGIILFSFNSENDISYTLQDRKAKIQLSDSINLLQDQRYNNNLIFSNTDALTAFVDICSFLNIVVNIDEYTKNYLSNIYIKQMPINADNHWNIIEQFAFGVRAIFYKLGKTYYLRRIKE